MVASVSPTDETRCRPGSPRPVPRWPAPVGLVPGRTNA